MTPRPAMWSSWCFGWDNSALGLVDSWDSIMQPNFVLGLRSCGDATNCCLSPETFGILSFAKHGRSHGYLQLPSCVFHGLLTLMIVWINKINSPQSSSIIYFRLFHCPFLFFPILCGFPNLRPYFGPHKIRSGSRWNFCQSPRGPHISFGKFLFQ